MKFALAKCNPKPVLQDEGNANIEHEFPFKKIPPEHRLQALYRHPVIDFSPKGSRQWGRQINAGR